MEERGRRRERGLDDDSVCRLQSQSCGSSVDGARSSSVQTHAVEAPRVKGWEKETWGQRTGGGGCVRERQERLWAV